MKLFLLLSAILFASLSVSGFRINVGECVDPASLGIERSLKGFIEGLFDKLGNRKPGAKELATVFLADQLLSMVVDQVGNENDLSPKAPILPDLPEHICINGTEELGTINIPISGFGANLTLKAGSLEDTQISGLHTLKDNLDFIIITGRLNWRIDLDLLEILTHLVLGIDIEMHDLSVNPPPLIFNLSAEANLTDVKVDKAFVNLQAVIGLVKPVTINQLNLDFGLELLHIIGSASLAIGPDMSESVDGDLGPTLYDIVRNFWDGNKDDILGEVKCLVNFALSDCGPADLITNGTLPECIKNPFFVSDCIDLVEPTTPVEPNPTTPVEPNPTTPAEPNPTSPATPPTTPENEKPTTTDKPEETTSSGEQASFSTLMNMFMLIIQCIVTLK